MSPRAASAAVTLALAAGAMAPAQAAAPGRAWGRGHTVARAGDIFVVDADSDAAGRSLLVWDSSLRSEGGGTHSLFFSTCTPRACAHPRRWSRAPYFHELNVTADGRAHVLTVDAKGRLRLAGGTTSTGLTSSVALAPRQRADSDESHLASGPNGPTVAVWQRRDGGHRGMYLARAGQDGPPLRLARNGTPRGVTVDADGTAVVVWLERRRNTQRLFVTRVTPGGGVGRRQRLGPVLDRFDDDIYDPSAVLAPDGSIAVAWTYDFAGSGGPDGTDGAYSQEFFARVAPGRRPRARALSRDSSSPEVFLAAGRAKLVWSDGGTLRAATVTASGLREREVLNEGQRQDTPFAYVSTSGAGDALVAWPYRTGGEFSGKGIRTAYLPPGASRFERPQVVHGVRRDRRNRFVETIAPALRRDGSGRALAAYKLGDEPSNYGSPRWLRVARRR